MKKAPYSYFSPLLLLFLLGASTSALADDAALRQCRALPDAASRLGCYDAIPLGAAPAAARAPVAAARAPVAAAAAPAAVAAPAPAAAPAAPAATAEQGFGMETVQKQAGEPNFIDSTIVGKFDGWGPNARIKLANGQVWRVVDGSEAVLAPMDNPQVRVERNFFGTMFLKIEGTNNSPKVRRVQ
jgi:hypothetical protein